MRTKSILLTILCFALLVPVASSANMYEATLPTFPVTVNGEVIDNNAEEYPLLLVNGITYFPMTWAFSQELGLKTDFNSNDGFMISNGAGLSKESEDYFIEQHIANIEAHRTFTIFSSQIGLLEVAMNLMNLSNTRQDLDESLEYLENVYIDEVEQKLVTMRGSILPQELINNYDSVGQNIVSARANLVKFDTLAAQDDIIEARAVMNLIYTSLNVRIDGDLLVLKYHYQSN